MKYFWIVALAALAAYLACFVFAIGVWQGHLPEGQAAGEFGDTFGIVNALFSGAAFAGLFYALIQQREERQTLNEQISLQKDELADVRAANLARQRSEEFFQLLELLRKYVLEASCKYKDESFSGNDYWNATLSSRNVLESVLSDKGSGDEILSTNGVIFQSIPAASCVLVSLAELLKEDGDVSNRKKRLVKSLIPPQLVMYWAFQIIVQGEEYNGFYDELLFGSFDLLEVVRKNKPKRRESNPVRFDFITLALLKLTEYRDSLEGR